MIPEGIRKAKLKKQLTEYTACIISSDVESIWMRKGEVSVENAKELIKKAKEDKELGEVHKFINYGVKGYDYQILT